MSAATRGRSSCDGPRCSASLTAIRGPHRGGASDLAAEGRTRRVAACSLPAARGRGPARRHQPTPGLPSGSIAQRRSSHGSAFRSGPAGRRRQWARLRSALARRGSGRSGSPEHANTGMVRRICGSQPGSHIERTPADVTNYRRPVLLTGGRLRTPLGLFASRGSGVRIPSAPRLKQRSFADHVWLAASTATEGPSHCALRRKSATASKVRTPASQS